MAIGLPAQLGLVTYPRGPRTTAQMMASESGVIAAVDGPMFSKCSGQPSGYDSYTCGVVEYRHLDASKGVDVATSHNARGMLLAVKGGAAYALRGGTEHPETDVAVQLYPSMVWEGRNEGSTSNDTNATIRAAAGILADGRVFVAVAEPMGIRAMADVLIRMGATHAGYTDGGGSGALFVRAQGATPEVRYNTTGRRVVSWITLENRSVAASVAYRAKQAMMTAVDVVSSTAGVVVGASIMGVASLLWLASRKA